MCCIKKILGGTALLGILIYSQLKSANCITEEELHRIMDHADKLYDSNKIQEALKYLEPYSESSSAEILWRLARVCYKVCTSTDSTCSQLAY